jgi:hypothetical protein
MKPIPRNLALTSALLVAALEIATPPAQAQPNTYADFPFQQGSLFYQYNPPNRPRRSVARPRYTAPAQTGSYTAQPQPGYSQSNYYAQPRPGYAVQPQQGYYYTQPQQGSYYSQPRRGLFGRMLNR